MKKNPKAVKQEPNISENSATTSSNSTSSQNNHNQIETNQFITTNESNKHKCEYCDKQFSHKRSLTRHLRTHKANKQLKCSKCSFTSNRSDVLKNPYASS